MATDLETQSSLNIENELAGKLPADVVRYLHGLMFEE